MAKSKGLGKGLNALFVDNDNDNGAGAELNISEIIPDRNQPRSSFDESLLEELADSITEHGILQPIVVRPIPTGGYMIVAGERRFRAAHKAGLTTIPAIVKSITDQEAIEIALIENLQRDDLNPVEEAKGYKRLMEQAGLSQEEAAQKVGRSRSAVANSLRLLSLPSDVLELLSERKMTTGHAKVLLSLDDDDLISEAAKTVISGKLSVRETEKLCSKPKKQRERKAVLKDSVASEVELSLKNTLGVGVNVRYIDGKGSLSIDFYSKEQLFEFANKLGGK